jgi:8-oxo-dGTP pyrophosphatase MutT (NUDIX family)
MRKFTPSNAKLVPPSATKVFSGVIFDVYQWQQEMFDGSVETFERLKRPDTVKIIAVKDKKIIVLEEEQPDIGIFYSFSGGRHDAPEEDELQAAKRELLEETGMRFSNWKLISAVQPVMKIDWIVYTFLATDFIDQTNQKLDAGEKVTVTLKTLAEVRDLSHDPKARDLEKDLFEKLSSVEELINLPDCSK